MKTVIEGYRVINTNGSKSKKNTHFAVDANGKRVTMKGPTIYPNVVRVLDPNGKVVGNVKPTQRNPLKYIRTHKSSIYREELVGQLTAANVPDSVIQAILNPTPVA